MQWQSLMAIGDSFTEGLQDPGENGAYRGWADRLAELMVLANPEMRYANLGVRGKMMADIVAGQVPIAVAERPDLVTLCAGGNDLILPGADIDALAAQFAGMVEQLRAAGCEVVIFTGPDVKHMPVVRAVRSKIALYNSHLWSIANRYDTRVVDLWGMDVLRDERAWNDDRLHFSPEGHHRIALRAAEVLELALPEPWNTPWPEVDPTDWLHLRQKDWAWLRTHLIPWVGRQLRGQSLGDGLSAKRPTLAPLPRHDHDLAG